MKLLTKLFHRWFHAAVFAAWTIFPLYLLISRRYMTFLRPEFGILLALAGFIAMGFVIAAVVRPKTTTVDTSAVLRALVLLVPILYYVIMPQTVLGNHAVKKRFIGVDSRSVNLQTPAEPASQEPAVSADVPVAAVAEETEAEPSQPQESMTERTLLEVLRTPDSYKGKQVRVMGMIMRDETFKSYFGGRDTAVYRFLITCCVADALPLVIPLDLNEPTTLANDQWVWISGVFDLVTIDNVLVPIILEPKIEPVEAPSDPYLF